MSKYQARSAPPNHPRAHAAASTKTPWINEHILIAERALGKHLPPLAEVHHVDERKRNNTPSNLVICQDGTYHKLLHVRAKVVRGGGNPNTHKFCSTCKALKPFADFNRMKSSKAYGLQSQCRACSKSTFNAWFLKHKASAA